MTKRRKAKPTDPNAPVDPNAPLDETLDEGEELDELDEGAAGDLVAPGEPGPIIPSGEDLSPSLASLRSDVNPRAKELSAEKRAMLEAIGAPIPTTKAAKKGEAPGPDLVAMAEAQPNSVEHGIAAPPGQPRAIVDAKDPTPPENVLSSEELAAARPQLREGLSMSSALDPKGTRLRSPALEGRLDRGTPRLRVLSPVHHDGKVFAIGDEIELSPEDARRLYKMGAVGPLDG